MTCDLCLNIYLFQISARISLEGPHQKIKTYFIDPRALEETQQPPGERKVEITGESTRFGLECSLASHFERIKVSYRLQFITHGCNWMNSSRINCEIPSQPRPRANPATNSTVTLTFSGGKLIFFGRPTFLFYFYFYFFAGTSTCFYLHHRHRQTINMETVQIQ